MWSTPLPIYYTSLSLLLFTMTLISIAQSSSSASSNQSISTFSIARFNLNQLPYTVRLSGSCRDSIATRERTCYARYLDRFDGFEVKGSAEEDSSSPVLTSDVSSEFERRTCCAIWQWHSCTSPAFNQEHCTAADWAQWMDWPYAEGENGNGVTYLCSGYEYNSVWCWPFPLWTYIAFGLFLVVLLSAGILGVIWFWRRGSSGSSSERERRRRKPVNIRTVRANHKRSQNVYV